VPVGVTDSQGARSTYALSKIGGESAVTHYADAYGFEAVIVRYHNVYGPRMGFDHVIPELMERALNEVDPFPVYGLEQTRAFCYVTDAVDASLALMNCRLDQCELVHVGNDNEIRISELLEKVLGGTGFQPAIQALPAAASSVSRRCPDIGKLRRLTGFSPMVSIQEGLALTWDWYRQNRRPNVESGFVASGPLE
jgi:UDP-glucuronate decarboxylase